MMNCVAIDDEPLALELIKKHLSEIPEVQLLQTFDDPLAALAFLQKNTVDILLIDINMPDITGLELVKQLENPPRVIFTTAYKKFAVEGFELDAVDYIIKPITFERLKKAISKAIQMQPVQAEEKENTDTLFVRAGYKLVPVPISDIQYVEGLQDYVRIFTSQPKAIVTRMTMKGILDKLPEDKFKRIHRSYIVSVAAIQNIANKKVKLRNGSEFAIGSRYLDQINEWIRK